MTDTLPSINAWPDVLSLIKQKAGDSMFNLWFAHISFISSNDVELNLNIPNKFFHDWISENFPNLIADAWNEITGQSPLIKYCVSENDAKAHASRVHEEIFNSCAQLELKISPLPTSMCRVSPFFPLSKSEMINRKQITDLVIGSGSWGTLTYTGPQLCIHDEDYLCGILGMIQKRKSPSFELICNARELLAFCEQNDSKGNYERLKKSLNLMLSCKITLSRRSSENKKKRSVKWDSSNILSFVGGDDTTGKLKIVPNPYFYEMYLAKDYTLLDIQRRAKIKGLISKALYRFVMSHQYMSEPIPYSIETLNQVLNLNETLPLWKRRQQIEAAVEELIKERILIKTSRVDRDANKVYLIKHPVKSKVGYIENQKPS